MTHAHHDASAYHQRRSSESEFFCAEQCCDDNVTTSLHLTICLHHDAVTKTIQHKCLLRFSETKFPRCTCVLQRCQWRCTSTAVVTRDEYYVCLCLAHTSGNCSHSNFSNQLHVNACQWVCVLQVVNQLLEVFNGIDVVVWRWADQPNSRSGVTCLCHPWVHLVARQLSTLTRLCTLSHLDLNVVSVDQVFAGDTKAT